MKRMTAWFTIPITLLLFLLAPISASAQNDLSPEEQDAEQLIKLRNDKVKNIRKMSMEMDAETDQPQEMLARKKAKTIKTKYKMNFERLDDERDSKMPKLRMEMEMTEPMPMRMKMDISPDDPAGGTAYFADAKGEWHAMKLTPELEAHMKENLKDMISSDPASRRKTEKVRVKKHNKPLFFGTETKTVEHVPQTKVKMYHRMEEDIDVRTGLALETRVYDEKGNMFVEKKVKKWREINGIPMVEETEMVSRTKAGEVKQRMNLENIQIVVGEEER